MHESGAVSDTGDLAAPEAQPEVVPFAVKRFDGYSTPEGLLDDDEQGFLPSRL